MKKLPVLEPILLGVAILLPVVEGTAWYQSNFKDWALGNEIAVRIFIYAIMALGLNIVVGYTGLLHLGVAAFVSIGVYTYAILTTDIYPFQVGFWWALLIAPVVCALTGVLLASPTLRLRGDYLAIVTLGFMEIVSDVLRNVEKVTKGMQAITDLPPPTVPSVGFLPADLFRPSTENIGRYVEWYYLFLAILVLLMVLIRNLERSRVGRQWMSIREDELAATCMGIQPVRTKLLAFALGAAICGISGVLAASKAASSSDPTAYDFNMSITVLSIAIVGGLGSLRGILVGSVLVMGFDILLKKITEELQRNGVAASDNVFLNLTNWKFLIFGLALVLMMRFKPEGICPSARVEIGRKKQGPGSAPPVTV